MRALENRRAGAVDELLIDQRYRLGVDHHEAVVPEQALRLG